MQCIKEHGRCLAYILWLFTIAIMVSDFLVQFDNVETLDINVDKIPVSALFYLVANAMLLFRVFGANWCVKIVHVIIGLASIPVLFLNFDKISKLNGNILICLTALQICLAMYLLVLRPGHTALERAFHAGVHATIGLAVAFAYFLITCYIVQPDYNVAGAILQMTYMLLFLFVLLTPYCQAPNQAAPLADEERRRILAILAERARLENELRSQAGAETRENLSQIESEASTSWSAGKRRWSEGGARGEEEEEEEEKLKKPKKLEESERRKFGPEQKTKNESERKKLEKPRTSVRSRLQKSEEGRERKKKGEK